MRGRTGFLLVVMIFLFFILAQRVGAEYPQKIGSLEIGSVLEIDLGLAAKFRRVRIPRKAVPKAVRDEADNPIIYHPGISHSNCGDLFCSYRLSELFERDEIGAFNPGEKFNSFERNAFLRLFIIKLLITDLGLSIRPFLEIGDAECNVSTNKGNKGSYDEGYSYFKLLGDSYWQRLGKDAVDYAAYWYGIEYDLELFYPAVGISFDMTDRLMLIIHARRQQLTLNYEKGIDAYYIPPKSRIHLGTTYHKIYTYSLFLSWVIPHCDKEDVSFNIEFGPYYAQATNGIKDEWGAHLGIIVGISFKNFYF